MNKNSNEMKHWKSYICLIIRDITYLEYRDLKKVHKLVNALMQQKYDEIMKIEVE